MSEIGGMRTKTKDLWKKNKPSKHISCKQISVQFLTQTNLVHRAQKVVEGQGIKLRGLGQANEAEEIKPVLLGKRIAAQVPEQMLRGKVQD